MRTSPHRCIVLILLGLSPGFYEGASAQALPIYTVAKKVPLSAPDRWDYLSFDASSGRVYVAHGDAVSVVDGRDGTVLGQIGNFPGGSHGVAIASANGKGYSDDGKAGTVTSFDLATLKPLRTVRSAVGADGIIFDPFSHHVFVVNGGSGSVTVIDPVTDVTIAHIEVGGDLEFATADGKGNVYINGAEKREIVRIDTTTNRVEARWPIPNCERPHGIATDPLLRRIFVTCVNNLLVVVNSENGATVATLPIGSRSDAAAFDPKRKLVFSSNGDGTLTVIAEKSADKYSVLGNIPTALGARTMTLDPTSGRIYLVTANYSINEKADPTDARHRYTVLPGTVHMLFMDPER